MDYGTLCAMLAIDDTFNCDRNSYAYDGSFASEAVAVATYENTSDKIFNLYARSPGSTATAATPDSYNIVANPDSLFHTSCDLFLKKKDDHSYVNIYSLCYPTLSSSVVYDTALRVSALLYAMASLRRKFLFLRLKDTQAMNAEQERLIAHYKDVQILVDELRILDASETDSKKYAQLPPPFDAIVFMVDRRLMDSISVGGKMDKSYFDTIRAYIADPTDASKEAAARSAVDGATLDRNAMAILGDLLRSYGDRVSSLVSESTTQLQLEMQFSQQDTAMASTLMTQVQNLRDDEIRNVQ
jgi:hypothetical protein